MVAARRGSESTRWQRELWRRAAAEGANGTRRQDQWRRAAMGAATARGGDKSDGGINCWSNN
jgi:hypothetical protein